MNYWNIARIVDSICNELGITVPVAVHADHYGIKSDKDLAAAKVEVPTMFDAGLTSSPSTLPTCRMTRTSSPISS